MGRPNSSTAGGRVPATVSYLSFDALTEGVGASQVLPYVVGLAERGVSMRLCTFEKTTPPASVVERLTRAGVEWTALPFGAPGAKAGAMRVARAARWLRGADLVHARSDLAAAAALLARVDAWIWDMRSFWADQRIALGTLRPGSPEERVLRFVERRSAQTSSAIVTLAHAANDELGRRHGSAVFAKTHVITTCVDLTSFRLTPPPPDDVCRVLLSGTLNGYYDVPAMLRLAALLEERRPTALTVLTPEPGPWRSDIEASGAVVRAARPADMPAEVAAYHVGFSVCRLDAGVSLLAAMPTKIGEFLATGRPVVVNRGLGDMDELLAKYRCGVVVSDTSERGLSGAIDELETLLADDEVADRCRTLAERHFNLDLALDALVSLYAGLTRR